MPPFDVIIEEPAYCDLQNIFDYLVGEVPYLAEKILDNLILEMESLRLFPHRHTVILSIQGVKVRQLIFKKVFRILYVVQENTVHVLHCFRCEQLFPNL